MFARLDTDMFDPLTYGRILYLWLALPLGIVEFSFLVTAISIGAGLAITLIGIPILIGSMYAWSWLADRERDLIGALTGVEIERPYRPLPDGSRSQRLHARLADPATWKDLVFLLLQLPIGAVSFAIAATVLSTGLAAVTLPLWFWAVPGGVELGIFTVDRPLEAIALVPLGAIVLRLGIPGLGALGRFYAAYAQVLLGPNVDPELTAQVSDLRDARSRIIEAADAERRRIERDLHDGAQQRLVALALTLRMAEKRASEGGPAAAELVRSAGEEAGLALKELRDLARGIHPAILTNRGLAAALEDLAGRAAVPVQVVAAPTERLPVQVEAAAYFVVSECLANIGKHARASSATVAVTAGDGALRVVVADDGVGGARLDNGSGLQGLEDRVGALDGSLALESPAGVGTRVEALIPLVGHTQPPEPARTDGPRVLSDEDAAALDARRRHRLRLRTGALGIVAFLLLAVWGLTGAPSPWPVWPLLGLGVVAGLDAWIVLSSRPLRESELGGADSARALRRRRRLRTDAGVLVIVNVFLVGIWLAAGAGYFWPAWPMLGTGVAFGLKALPWPGRARERYAS